MPDDRTGMCGRPGSGAVLIIARQIDLFCVPQVTDARSFEADHNGGDARPVPVRLTLLTGLADWPPERRNTIRYLFLHPAAREARSSPGSGSGTTCGSGAGRPNGSAIRGSASSP
jgi:hypothetical protein